MSDYGEARAAYKELVLSRTYSAWAEEAKNTALTDIPAFGDMVFPDWIDPTRYRANIRTLDLDAVVGRKLVEGLTRWPERDELPRDVTTFEYEQAMKSVLLAGGAVVSAWVLFGSQSQREQPDRTMWRRINMAAPVPAEVLDALAEAQAAVRVAAPVIVGFILNQQVSA